MRILAELNPLEPITAVPLLTFHLGDAQVVVSNHAAMVVVATVILLVAIPLAARSPKLVPRGLQNLVESVCVFLREQMARPLLGSHTDQYIGFIWTTFFFILTLNLVALIPMEKIVSLATGKTQPLRGPRHREHLDHRRPGGRLLRHDPRLRHPAARAGRLSGPSGASGPGVADAADLPAGVAGHVRSAVLPWPSDSSPTSSPATWSSGSILGLVFIFKNLGVASVSVVACVALSFLELLVAFIQAYVFTFLTALYIALATSSEH